LLFRLLTVGGVSVKHTARWHSVSEPTEDPMRTASHIAAALSAATGRSARSNGWPLVGACLAYRGFPNWLERAPNASTLKPE
jgi:hypothetical protein